MRREFESETERIEYVLSSVHKTASSAGFPLIAQVNGELSLDSIDFKRSGGSSSKRKFPDSLMEVGEKASWMGWPSCGAPSAMMADTMVNRW